MSTKITTPPGRIVWGNPQVGREKKDNAGNKVVKDGKTVLEYQFGLAIEKSLFAPVGAVMQAEASAVSAGQPTPPDFAFKVKDGDTGVDRKGNPLRDKPGYAGCYVLACSTEFPIPVFKRNGNAFEQLVTGGIKTGDYARAELTINGHGRAPGKMGAKPGLYLNPNMVELLGYGDAIVGAATNPEDAFGEAVALPQGASLTPTASGPMPSTGASPFAASPPAPAAVQPQAPAAAPQPHGDFPWGGKP